MHARLSYAKEVAAAAALLQKVAGAILDDWTAYTEGGEEFPADGFDAVDPDRIARMGSLNAIRRAVADAILAIEKAK